MSAITTMIFIPFNTVTTSSIPPSSSHFQSCQNRAVTITAAIRRRRSNYLLTLCTTPADRNPVLSQFKDNPLVSSSSLDSASDVVRKFYGGINSRHLSPVQDLIADNCVYEDLVFPQPFVGRKAILDFFEKFVGSISRDLQFVIDDISGEDTSAVGVTWHLEWKGRPFPFSKGCSFYRLEVENGRRKITYARDVVEPAVKPGDFVLPAIRAVTWLLQRFPHLVHWL